MSAQDLRNPSSIRCEKGYVGEKDTPRIADTLSKAHLIGAMEADRRISMRFEVYQEVEEALKAAYEAPAANLISNILEVPESRTVFLNIVAKEIFTGRLYYQRFEVKHEFVEALNAAYEAPAANVKANILEVSELQRVFLNIVAKEVGGFMKDILLRLPESSKAVSKMKGSEKDVIAPQPESSLKPVSKKGKDSNAAEDFTMDFSRDLDPRPSHVSVLEIYDQPDKDKSQKFVADLACIVAFVKFQDEKLSLSDLLSGFEGLHSEVVLLSLELMITNQGRVLRPQVEAPSAPDGAQKLKHTIAECKYKTLIKEGNLVEAAAWKRCRIQVRNKADGCLYISTADDELVLPIRGWETHRPVKAKEGFVIQCGRVKKGQLYAFLFPAFDVAEKWENMISQTAQAGRSHDGVLRGISGLDYSLIQLQSNKLALSLTPPYSGRPHQRDSNSEHGDRDPPPTYQQSEEDASFMRNVSFGVRDNFDKHPPAKDSNFT